MLNFEDFTVNFRQILIYILGMSAENQEIEEGKEAFKTPEDLAAAQNNADHFNLSTMISSLPKVVKRRLKALKKLQVESNQLEAQFYEQLHKVECEYEKKYETLFTKRSEIINAKVEPNDVECEWSENEDDPLSDKFYQLKVNENSEKDLPASLKLDESVKGIPEFWLTIFKNVELLREMVQEDDIPILKYLQDITVHLDAEGFKLDFWFNENENFTNKVLSKYYHLRFKPEKDEVLTYEGPEIYKCTGTEIDWKENKNVTVKFVKKVQKHKNRGTKRVLTKTVQTDSFFNFFSPPQVTEGEELDEETDSLLESDFEIGQYLRERVIPRAVLYYTGEIVDADEDDDDDDYEEGDDDEDEEEDEEEDEN